MDVAQALDEITICESKLYRLIKQQELIEHMRDKSKSYDESEYLRQISLKLAIEEEALEAELKKLKQEL